MKYKWNFVCLVSTLIGVVGTFYFAQKLGESQALLWALGGIFVVLHLLSWVYFYRLVISPIRILESGMGLLQSQDFSSRLTRVGQKDADNLVAVFNEMISRLREERLLVQETNHFLDLLINASPMGIVMLDLDKRVKVANPATFRLLSIGDGVDLIGMSVRDLSDNSSVDLSTIPLGGRVTVRPTGTKIIKCSHLSFQRMGMKQSFYLIESLAEEVRRAERETYEKVVRMIAHEVNNTNAGMTSTLQSIHDILQHEEGYGDLVEAIESCSFRTEQMSAFIRDIANVVKIPEPRMIEDDIHALLIRCIRFMEIPCRQREIIIEEAFVNAPLVVAHDATLIEQAILNILKNAMESIGQNGEIIVRTSVAPKGIVIEDNGPGIPRDVENKIFTPFFSTKENGQGIGLLFINEVLDRHKCMYTLKTDSDGKTRFTILF